ncbi:MAG TPA: dihydroneopterin aldolase [Candidatus Nitrosotenuis sp.]|jgi:dihydroneopterin aldolase|nr:dihydroneopterin aldolase [Candidatus Nitrosotenuis sp.]
MKDHLFIEGLQVDCLIGRAEWERMVAQTVRLDLRLECDLARVAAHDDVVEGTLDSKALSKRLQAFVSQTRFRMLETLAEAICRLVLTEFPVRRVRLRLSKPGALRGAREVGVVLTRRAGDYPD